MYVHTITVTGRGEFPMDMLRYAQAYPVDHQSADGLSEPHMRRTIRLAYHSGTKYPNDNIQLRFESFGWAVDNHEFQE